MITDARAPNRPAPTLAQRCNPLWWLGDVERNPAWPSWRWFLRNPASNFCATIIGVSHRIRFVTTARAAAGPTPARAGIMAGRRLWAARCACRSSATGAAALSAWSVGRPRARSTSSAVAPIHLMQQKLLVSNLLQAITLYNILAYE